MDSKFEHDSAVPVVSGMTLSPSPFYIDLYYLVSTNNTERITGNCISGYIDGVIKFSMW